MGVTTLLAVRVVYVSGHSSQIMREAGWGWGIDVHHSAPPSSQKREVGDGDGSVHNGSD